MASHATLDGFVRLQALQRLLGSTVVCVAEYLCKHLGGELVCQQAEALLEPRRSATLPCGITQLVLEVLTVHFVVPVVLRAVLDVQHQVAECQVLFVNGVGARLEALLLVS